MSNDNTDETDLEEHDWFDKLPENVQAKLLDSTKSFNPTRVRKLLRDTHYIGPTPIGKGARKSMGQNVGSPGSGMRRSKDGALYNATKSMRQAILDRALETGLIKETKWGYATTPKGVDVLHTIDVCSECGKTKEPKIREWTVQISRHNTATNYALTTICPDCGPDKRGQFHDDPRSYGTDRDGALQTLKNESDPSSISLYGVSEDDLDDWVTPAYKAAEEFRENINNGYDFTTAFYVLEKDFTDQWALEACHLIAQDYAEHTIEHIICKTKPFREENEHSRPFKEADYDIHDVPDSYPKALPGEGFRVTFDVDATDSTKQLIFNHKGTYYEKRSDVKIAFTSTYQTMRRGSPFVHVSYCGPIGDATEVDHVVLSEDYETIDHDTIEEAKGEWRRKMRGFNTTATERTFSAIIDDLGLTAAETIAFARIARHLKQQEDEYVADSINSYAERDLLTDDQSVDIPRPPQTRDSNRDEDTAN